MAKSNWMETLSKDPVGAALMGKKLLTVSFTIDSESWVNADMTPPFQWDSVEFKKANAKDVPTEPGLYAFVLRLPYDGLPPHGWVMYIGESGHGDSKHNLRERFKNYHAEQKKFKRAQTFFMLNAWKDKLLFFYTKLPSRKHELKDLETKLLDAFRPPYSRGGYSASLISTTGSLLMKQLPRLQLPALRGHFGDWIYYSCIMRMPELANRVDYAEALHPNKQLSQLIQRSLKDKRAGEIAEYLRREKERFFNSLVIAVYGGEPHWSPVKIDDSKSEYSERLDDQTTENSLGILTLSGKEELFAIDGQHRLSGMKAFFSTKGNVDSNDDVSADLVPILLVAHSNATIKRTRRLFTTLNKTAIPVSKKERIALDENDAMAIISRRLVEEHDWFGERRIAMAATNNLSINDKSSLTTIGNLYDILTILFVDIEKIDSKKNLQTIRLSDVLLDQCFEIAIKYFETLGSIIPELKLYFKSSAPESIVSQCRHGSGGSIYFRPLGLTIITEVVRAIKKDGKNWKTLLPKLPRDLNKVPFQGLLWTDRSTIQPAGKVLTRELLEYIAGLPAKQDLHSRYAKFLGRSVAKTKLPPQV
jgi:DNA sulfur modification protein DndB